MHLMYVALHKVVWCTQNIPRWQQFYVAPAMSELLGSLGGVVNSLDFCPALLLLLPVHTFFTMEGNVSEFANFTLPTLKAFLEACSQNVSGNMQQLAARAIGCPKMHFFHELTIFWWAKKMTQRHFFFHPLSPVIFATATVVAFALLSNSRFNFRCYTQCEATPTQKLAGKWHCNLSWLLTWKITKGIHSWKPASLNHPISIPLWWIWKKCTIKSWSLTSHVESHASTVSLL